jgi:hypothetical protein
MEQSKFVYNQLSIEKSLNELQEDELKNFTLLFDVGSEMGDITILLEDFIEKAEMRLTQEKLLFRNNILVFFVKGFNKTLDSFLPNSGKDYLDSIIESDYLSNISPEFNKMMLYVNNTYKYINALLDDVLAKMISKLIVRRLNSVFGEIRDDIQEVIQTKIDTIIQNKFEKFKNQVLYLIPKYFLDQLKEIIESEDFINTLNKPKVYELIPTNYTDGFRSNLTDILHSRLTTDQIKQDYQNRVNEDFNDIINILTEYHVLMGKRASSASQSYSSGAMNTIILDYITWSEVVSKFDIIYVLNVSDSKKNPILDFFNTYIIPNIKSINDGYIYEKTVQLNNMQSVLDNYRKRDFLKEVQEELDKFNLSTNLDEIKKEIKRLMEELYTKIKEMFDNIGQMMIAESKPTKGFTLKDPSQRRNLRHLTKYDLVQINNALSITQQKYYEFRDRVLKNDNLAVVAFQIGVFNSKFSNIVFGVSDYFKVYENFISDFIDASIVLNQIEQSADQVANHLSNYVLSSASSVYKVIDQIRVRVMDGWNKIKSRIDDSLENTLDSVFTTLFSELTTFSYGDSKDLSQFDAQNYYVYDDKDQVLVHVKLVLNTLNVKHEYSIHRNLQEPNYFDVHLNVVPVLSGEITITIADTFKNYLNGTLGAGNIGMDIYYRIHEKSVNVEAFSKTDSSKYISEYSQYSYDENKWDTFKTMTQESIGTIISSSNSKEYNNNAGKISQHIVSY